MIVISTVLVRPPTRGCVAPTGLLWRTTNLRYPSVSRWATVCDPSGAGERGHVGNVCDFDSQPVISTIAWLIHRENQLRAEGAGPRFLGRVSASGAFVDFRVPVAERRLILRCNLVATRRSLIGRGMPARCPGAFSGAPQNVVAARRELAVGRKGKQRDDADVKLILSRFVILRFPSHGDPDSAVGHDFNIRCAFGNR